MAVGTVTPRCCPGFCTVGGYGLSRHHGSGAFVLRKTQGLAYISWDALGRPATGDLKLRADDETEGGARSGPSSGVGGLYGAESCKSCKSHCNDEPRTATGRCECVHGQGEEA